MVLLLENIFVQQNVSMEKDLKQHLDLGLSCPKYMRTSVVSANPKMAYVYVQVAKPSGGCRNYDHCPSVYRGM